MGVLRQKAESEVRFQEAREQERQRAEKAKRERDIRERLPDVVEYLRKWSGEEVTPAMLKLLNPDHGPLCWEVALDGFELQVRAIDRKTEPCEVIEQRTRNGQLRPIKLAKELLVE